LATKKTTKRGSEAGSTASPRRLLEELERIAPAYGDGVAARKRALIEVLGRAELPTAGAVSRLHEVLLLLRAYPDDAGVLEAVERNVEAFRRRKDLRRHRAALADTGIAGTRIHYAFYWEMARWLTKKCPGRLRVDWRAIRDLEAFERILHLLVLYAETPALDGIHLGAREWIDALRGEGETDAELLVRRFETLPTDGFGKEAMFDALDTPMWVDTDVVPSRTHAHLALGLAPVFQREPRTHARPDLRRAIRVSPVSERALTHTEGEKLVDLAREAMVTRMRDLDAIANADPRDARVFDGGDGFAFACLGVKPERRLMLEAVHLFLVLKNGVPIGYFQAATLFGTSELNFNVFEPYRGAEAASIYARAAAVVRRFLGSDVFAVDPYQLGSGNPEAIRSGAFWFYYKLGFRPVSAEVARLAERELRAMKKRPKHRTSEETLLEMSVDYLLFFLGEERDDVIGKLAYANVGARVTDMIRARFDGDRVRAERECVREAKSLLGDTRGFTRDERLAFARWAPLVTILPGVDGWSDKDRRALGAVIRSKGGPHEIDFVRRFDAHPRLAKALAKLARPA
jgi:hypothetical protein